MKFINSKMHGVLDYLVAGLLIVIPWLLNLGTNTAATWVLVCAGVATICYSLVTNYEYSLLKTLPLQTHLVLDSISAIVLIASPWLFGFHEYVYLPHVAIGIIELVTVAMTKSIPANKPVKTEFSN